MRSSRARSAMTMLRSRSTAAVELVVDDDVVVLGERGDLGPRDLQPPLHRGLAVLAAAAQPLLEHLERRRHHEDRRGLDAAAPHLPRALHVDHQHHVLAGVEQRARCRPRRAVEVAEHVGPLEELAAAIIASNALAADEIIVHAVALAAAPAATCTSATSADWAAARPAARPASSCRCPTAPRR